MAKYNELINKFSEEIENIKALGAKHDEIKKRLDMAYEESSMAICEAIEDEMAANQIVLSQAQERLSHEIDMAYWDVPFAKTRKQGIANFWQLSGIGE